MSFVHARTRLAAVAVVCATALALSACGSSKSGSGSGSASGSGSGSATTANASSSAFAGAVAANAKFETRPTSIGITTPVGKPIPKGKVIDFIQVAVPAGEIEANILRQAAQQLGWKLDAINAGVTPQSLVDAYHQAITNRPAAVLASGDPRIEFNPELKQLAALHIPVVEAFTNDVAGDGLTGVIGGPVNSAIQGREVADFILAHSKSRSMTIGSVIPPEFPNLVAENQTLTATVHQYCSSCNVKTLDVPVTSIGSDLSSRVASFLSANPNITWTNVGYDDMMVGVPTALKGAGVTGAKLTTISLNAAIVPYLKQNELQATIGVSFPEVYWREIDLLARYFTNQSYKVDLNDATLPFWTITGANVPSTATSPEFANVVDYAQQFKKLWGLG